jgi:hypothetical protein
MRMLIAICALAVFGLGAVVAEDFVGIITKIETKDGKTTISGKKGNKKDTTEFTLNVAAGVKVNYAGKYDKEAKKFAVDDPIEEGLKNDIFKKVSVEKPLFASISTDKDDNVTSIVTGTKKKK